MLWNQPAPALVTADGWIKHGSANCPTGVAVWLRVSVQCGDETIAMVLVDGGQEFWYFYHTDGLGSVAALSQWNTADSQVEIVERYRYDDVFGRTTVCDGNGSPRTVNASAYGNPILFTGRRLDAETGLYDYRFRMYSPDLGRFLQTDPLGYIDGMNLYAHVNNNPLNWVDPWGLKRYNYRWYNIPLWPLVFANNLGETFADGIEGAYGMYDAMKNPPPPLDLNSGSDSRPGAVEKFKHDAFDVAQAVPHTAFTGPAPAPTGIADVVTDVIVDAIADISEGNKECQ